MASQSAGLHAHIALGPFTGPLLQNGVLVMPDGLESASSSVTSMEQAQSAPSMRQVEELCRRVEQLEAQAQQARSPHRDGVSFPAPAHAHHALPSGPPSLARSLGSKAPPSLPSLHPDPKPSFLSLPPGTPPARLDLEARRGLPV
jgi:hypothetical protein